jgi:dihydrofolate reductase
VFSRRPAPDSVPAGVHFVSESIRTFAEGVRGQPGKNVWLMGGGEIIGSFLDEQAIDEFIITVVPTFIGEGIPLIAPRHRHVPLRLLGLEQFSDGVVQLHYEVGGKAPSYRIASSWAVSGHDDRSFRACNSA